MCLFTFILSEFLKLALEENVDLLAVRCPYFLERCIAVILRSSLLLVDEHSSSHSVNNSTDHSNKTSDKNSRGTHVALTSSSLQAASARYEEVGVDQVWQALRLVRGVPSEVVANLSNQLGVGVLELLRSVSMLVLHLQHIFKRRLCSLLCAGNLISGVYRCLGTVGSCCSVCFLRLPRASRVALMFGPPSPIS